MIDGNDLANGDSLEFWTGVAEGKLLFQRCLQCHQVQFPPRHQCGNCWNEALEPLESCGKGTIESITIVRRAPLPAFRDRVPYAIAAVLVDEGPRMITGLVGEGAMDAAIGDTVQVAFVADADGRLLPQFQLATAG